MSDTAIKNALSRRDDLTRDIERFRKSIKSAETELARINAFFRAWQDFADEEEKRSVGPIPDVHVTSTSAPKPTNPKKEAVAGYAAEIIVQTGRPMKRTELFNALKARGIHLHGKNPGMVLSTMLWRMRSKIVRLHHYGYWVADQPFPLAGYDPSRPYTPKGAEPDERGLLDD